MPRVELYKALIMSDYRLMKLQEQNHSYFYFPFLALQECWESVLAGTDDSKAQDHTLQLYQWQNTNYKPSFHHLYHWPTKPSES